MMKISTFFTILLILVSFQINAQEYSLRINTGGSEVDYNNETYMVDTHFDTGSTLVRPQTGLPEPYQSFRYSRSQQMSYDIPIADGEYTVNLYFAELWFGATGGGSGGVGSRVFDINIEGEPAEDNLDVFAEVGADAMLMKSHTVTVSGGVLNIDFDSRDAVGGKRHPIINAIEILGEQAPQDIAIEGFTQVRSPRGGDSGPGVYSLNDGDQIRYWENDQYLYLVGVETTNGVKSVRYEYTNPAGTTEIIAVNNPDYYGDISQVHELGMHTIIATPYSEIDQGGEAGAPVTISYELIEGLNINKIAILRSAGSAPDPYEELENNGAYYLYENLAVFGGIQLEVSSNVKSLSYDIRGPNSPSVSMVKNGENVVYFKGEVGSYIMYITPYPEEDFGGVPGYSYDYEFEILDSCEAVSFEVINATVCNPNGGYVILRDEANNYDPAYTSSGGWNNLSFEYNDELNAYAARNLNEGTYTVHYYEDYGCDLKTFTIETDECDDPCYENLVSSFTIETTPWCDSGGGSIAITPSRADLSVTAGQGYVFEVEYREGNGGLPTYYSTALAFGNYDVLLSDSGNDCSANYPFIIEEIFDCPEPNDFALRINTGGAETDYNGEMFVTDTYSNTGSTLDRPQTGLPEPYQSMRFSRSQQMSYNIPLKDGEYTVNLYFAELWFGATGGGTGGVGSRVFDINIEGEPAEDNLDVFAEVGADAMLMKSHTVTVSGGVLNIDFDSRDAVGGKRHPIINAIEILGEATNTETRPFIIDVIAYNFNNNSVTIPVHPDYTYNYTVDWGDGTISSGVTGDITHTYSTNRRVGISISGNFPGIYYNNGEHTFQPVKIVQWGDMEWQTFDGAFYGCDDLTLRDITDVPDLSQVRSMRNMFDSCSNLVGNSSFNDWDVSNVTDMTEMFKLTPKFNIDLGDWDVGNVKTLEGTFAGARAFNQDLSGWNVWNVENMFATFNLASSFDQDLGSWDIRNVGNFGFFLNNTAMSTSNYDNTLEGWANLNGLNSNLKLDAVEITYCSSEDARQKLIDDYGWTIEDAGKAIDCEEPSERPFVTTWKTDNLGLSQDNQITIPTFDGETYNYSVDWGDGTSDSGVTGKIVHTYATPGVYQVSISGIFPRIDFHNIWDGVDERKKIIAIDQWGSVVWSTMLDAFVACSNLDVLATDIPNLSSATSTRSMFGGCSSLIGNEVMNSWDVSNIIDMRGMFGSTTVFNQDISNWDVSNVRDMLGMFGQASSFNQDIGDWNVGNVNNMRSMFGAATSFNQDISGWDVSNVIDMSLMFASAVLFDQPIGLWNVSNVTDMSWMFSGTTSFDQDLNDWDVSNVMDMKYMFQGTIFNKNIGNWNVGQVREMTNMFRLNTAFNQDIGSWNVSNVELMNSMFYEVPTFNQDLSKWNVGNVTDMSRMFYQAGLSIANYDSTLQGWISLPNLQTGVGFTASFSEYCLGAEARQNLIDQYGWMIDDAGENCTSEPGGIWLEAECAVIGSNWSVLNNANASGGQYLLPPSGFNSSPTYNSDSIVLFEAQISEAGIYTIHVLLNAPTTSADSFWVRVNNGSWLRWNNIIKNSNFQWNVVHDRENIRVPLSFDLSSGLNIIEFGHRESNVGLDKIHLTNTAAVPTGFGEIDETCNSSVSGKSANVDVNEVTLSPNPVIEATTLSFEQPVKLSDIQVFDVSGRLVRTFKATEVSANDTYNLNVYDLEPGTYFINALDNKGVNHQKQMVIKN